MLPHRSASDLTPPPAAREPGCQVRLFGCDTPAALQCAVASALSSVVSN